MVRVTLATVKDLCVKSLQALGHTVNDANIITDVLMYAELRGNNQGIIKLVSGALSPNPAQTEIRTIFESPLAARVDGGNRSGMVILSHSVDIAINKAKASGMAIVGCSGYASATGALGMWAKKLSDAGLIGIVLTQCSEMVAPHGSYEPIFGTNPFAIGVPTKPRAQILDMATSAMAYYGIKMADAAGQTIPGDVAYNNRGEPTTDPKEALNGAIRVFDRSYKGSHLALMVELLAGAFTGAAMEDKGQAKNWGSLVIAISANVFGNEDEFLRNAMTMCDRVKHAKLLPNEKKEIMLPGERGDMVEAENLALDSIELLEDTYQRLILLAGNL